MKFGNPFKKKGPKTVEASGASIAKTSESLYKAGASITKERGIEFKEDHVLHQLAELLNCMDLRNMEMETVIAQRQSKRKLLDKNIVLTAAKLTECTRCLLQIMLDNSLTEAEDINDEVAYERLNGSLGELQRRLHATYNHIKYFDNRSRPPN